MALVRYSVFYNGPFAVYTSRTGLTDIRTGLPELGGGLNLGDFCDLTEAEANSWSIQYGGTAKGLLHAGRYRFVYVQAASTAATCVFGYPCGIGLGTTVQQATITNAGTGATAGTYTIASSTSGGTATSILQYVVGSSGTIISANVLSPGAGFTSVPTWSLTASGTSGGVIVAQLGITENIVGSFDTTASISLYSPRGLFLNTTALTTTQVSAGAYVVIQEQGIGTAYVTTATNTAVPCSVSALTGGAVTTATSAANTVPAGFMGYTLDTAAAAAYCRFQMQLPQWPG